MYSNICITITTSICISYYQLVSRSTSHVSDSQSISTTTHALSSIQISAPTTEPKGVRRHSSGSFVMCSRSNLSSIVQCGCWFEKIEPVGQYALPRVWFELNPALQLSVLTLAAQLSDSPEWSGCTAVRILNPRVKIIMNYQGHEICTHHAAAAGSREVQWKHGWKNNNPIPRNNTCAC